MARLRGRAISYDTTTTVCMSAVCSSAVRWSMYHTICSQRCHKPVGNKAFRPAGRYVMFLRSLSSSCRQDIYGMCKDCVWNRRSSKHQQHLDNTVDMLYFRWSNQRNGSDPREYAVGRRSSTAIISCSPRAHSYSEVVQLDRIPATVKPARK